MAISFLEIATINYVAIYAKLYFPLPAVLKLTFALNLAVVL